jgi:GT2 family glycosyltransferase
MNKEFSFCVVVVTYNRKNDLETTLLAYLDQIENFDRILVVDNCSNDGTDQLLSDYMSRFDSKLFVEILPENSGGAGGFHAGLAKAREYGADWIWLSDDDAIPAPDCLEIIRRQISNTRQACVFGAAAVEKDNQDRLCWPVKIQQDGSFDTTAYRRSELKDIETTEMLPFLGFVIHESLIHLVGLPNRHYFLSGDDREYSLRLRRVGVSLYLLKNAVVVHPQIPRYTFSLFGQHVACLRLAPWRRFYDVRNRLWNARQYGGVPATVVSLAARLIGTLYYETDRFAQLIAFAKGVYTGLLQVVPGVPEIKSDASTN